VSLAPAANAVAVLAVAVALDLAFGDPPNRLHPVAWMGRLLAWGQRRLGAGSPPRLLLGGAALVLVVTGLAAGVGWMIAVGATRVGGLPGLALESLGLSCTLSLRGLFAAAGAVAADLVRGDVLAARATVARHLVSRPTGTLDARQVTSAAVESVAENLTDAFAAPLCFFLAFGLPGAFAYRAINTADAMLGYRVGALEHFGKTAARLDDVVNLAPARLAALAIVAAAALAGANARRAWRTMLRDSGRTASPNAGWTMAAMAGALAVTLEKPSAYRLGDGRAPLPTDIARSVRITAVAAALVLAGAAAARFAVGLARG
jgi:adenosylcobinamide-phosphate synthase